MSRLDFAPGTVLGRSEWFAIAQDRIDTFAEVTEDRQFIHTDPARAASSPFGGTIAHGFLTLSLLSRMVAQVLPELGDARESINYGFDKLRFLSPVPAGARVRGNFTVEGVEARKRGARLLRMSVSIEIEGAARPALIAEWLVLLVYGDHE